MIFDIIVIGLVLAVVLVGTAAGFTLAARRWRDQSPSATLIQLGIGAVVGLLAGMLLLAVLNLVTVLGFFAPIWFFGWTIGLLGAASRTYLRAAHDRRASRELAIATGIDPLVAAQLNRRPLLRAGGLVALYFGLLIAWLAAVAAVSYIQFKLENNTVPRWVNGPVFWTDAQGDGIVWWLLVPAALVVVGMVHGIVNAIRSEVFGR